MGGLLVRRSPSNFLDWHDLTLAVHGKFQVVSILDKVHVWLEEGFFADVAVMDFEFSSVHPVGIFVETMHIGANSVGKDVAICIFPV